MSKMTEWKCSKCAGFDYLYVPGYKGGGEGVHDGPFLFNSLQPSRYICGQCGFVEEYFDNPEHLEVAAKPLCTTKKQGQARNPKANHRE